MFAVFRFTHLSWSDLPHEFRNSPFLTLDLDAYICKCYKLPLSQMVRILVKDFLPASLKKYRPNNQRSSSKARKYSKEIPVYLHNVPHAVVIYCLDKIDGSEVFKKEDVRSSIDGTFEVRSMSRPTESYQVSISTPSCTCFTWRREALPCKHMFAVFRFTDLSWSDLPADDGSKTHLKKATGTDHLSI